MDSDGRRLQNLTNSPEDDSYPAWSRDGKKIAFTRHPYLRSALYIMNADGSNQHAIFEGPDPLGGPVAWSPDGQRLAFSADRFEDRHGFAIFSVNVDGSDQRQLTDGFSHDVEPSWSPDGTQIVFQRYGTGERPDQIYIMNADGSQLRKLMSSGRIDNAPEWSFDGEWIIFTRDYKQIWKVSPDGSERVKIARFNSDVLEPTWSPDGTKILFRKNWAVWRINVDGSGNQRRLRSGIAPTWQPIPEGP